jgi:hypothetical protein
LDVVSTGGQDDFQYISTQYNGNAEAPDDNVTTVERHLSGLIGTASHPDKQKIRLIGFFYENMHGLRKNCFVS